MVQAIEPVVCADVSSDFQLQEPTNERMFIEFSLMDASGLHVADGGLMAVSGAI